MIFLNYANYPHLKEQDYYVLFLYSLRLQNTLKQAAAMNFEY